MRRTAAIRTPTLHRVPISRLPQVARHPVLYVELQIWSADTLVAAKTEFNAGGILGLWSGMGEMEALSELFFDNLASLLSITSLVLGFYVNVIVVNTANSFDESGEYGEAIKNVYTKYYYERVIPGVGFALLFGNFYYGYMAGGSRTTRH